jgi:hypothetical protein
VIYLYFDRLRKHFTLRKPGFKHRPGFLIPGGAVESGD